MASRPPSSAILLIVCLIHCVDGMRSSQSADLVNTTWLTPPKSDLKKEDCYRLENGGCRMFDCRSCIMDRGDIRSCTKGACRKIEHPQKRGVAWFPYCMRTQLASFVYELWVDDKDCKTRFKEAEDDMDDEDVKFQNDGCGAKGLPLPCGAVPQAKLDLPKKLAYTVLVSKKMQTTKETSSAFVKDARGETVRPKVDDKLYALRLDTFRGVTRVQVSYKVKGKDVMGWLSVVEHNGEEILRMVPCLYKVLLPKKLRKSEDKSSRLAKDAQDNPIAPKVGEELLADRLEIVAGIVRVRFNYHGVFGWLSVVEPNKDRVLCESPCDLGGRPKDHQAKTLQTTRV